MNFVQLQSNNNLPLRVISTTTIKHLTAKGVSRMKRFFLLFSSVLLTLALSAMPRTVSLQEAGNVADNNARALWGDDLAAGEPLPYYGPDETIIAWQFDYAIGQPFPSRQALEQRSREAFQSDNPDLSWDNTIYANLVVGANRGMPVFIQYSQCLSERYVLAGKLEKLAGQAFPQGWQLEKTYYLGPVNIWYCVTDGRGKRYLNLAPPDNNLSEEEFRNYISSREFFWEDNDFTEEWGRFLDNGERMDPERSVHIIPGESYMPYIQWSYGCVPCSAAMVLAWWDNYHGLGKLIEHYFSRWDNVCDDFDDHVPSILPILANAMETGYESGSTDPWDVNDGLETAAMYQGYTVDCEGHWSFYWSDQTFFDDIVDYIDNDTPGLASIDLDFLDYHTTAAVGYNTSPQMVLVHDPNHDTLWNYSYSILEADWYVYPDVYQPCKVELESPHGGTNWNDNWGGNETLYSGDFHEIRWSGYIEGLSNNYVMLYYHTEGGLTPDGWELITAETENDGIYDWQVPAINCAWGDSTDYGRVKIVLQNDEIYTLRAQDGSYGNFNIRSGGGLEELTVPTTLDKSPQYYSAYPDQADAWYALGIKDYDDSLTAFWKIELFEEDNFADMIESASVWDQINYIVIDNHHAVADEYGVKLRYCLDDPPAPAVAQLSGDADWLLPVGSTLGLNWQQQDVVKMWNVYLTPGDYYFELDFNNGDADLDFALFKWGGDGIFRSSEAAAVSNNTGGAGETFHYSADTAGYYGLCISSRVAVATQYDVRITPAGKWTGAVSTDWFDSGNWYGGAVPGFDNDVIIPAGCSHYPNINAGITQPAYAKTVTVNAYSSLTVENGYLNIYGDLRVFGHFNLSHDSSEVVVEGNAVWEAGSYACSVADGILYLYKNLTVRAGVSFYMYGGTVAFVTGDDSFIECDSNELYLCNLRLNKASGAAVTFSELSEGPIRLYEDLRIESGSVFRSHSSQTIDVWGLFINNGSFQFDDGTLKIHGTVTYLYCNPGDYFYNLDASANDVTRMLTDLYLKGSLIINSDYFEPADYTVYIGGDWINNTGPGSFVKGNSTVVFNGNGQQDCHGEDFYILEIANSNCELHFDTGISSCDYYNWTAGTLYIDGGQLSIYETADPGIAGRTHVGGGTLDIHFSETQAADLNGELKIYGGAVNVHGGMADSNWPGTSHAWLVMEDGCLDFKDVGININHQANLLTADLSGGVIRTSCTVYCNRFDFEPEGGSFELYGPDDRTVYCISQSHFPSLVINTAPPARDDIAGSMARENSRPDRTNTVYLNSDLSIHGDLIILSGSLDLNGYDLDVSNAVQIFANLIMTDPAEVLDVGSSMSLGSGASGVISAGTINIQRNWFCAAGVTLNIGTGNTVNFVSSQETVLYLNSSNFCFGNLVVNKDSADCLIVPESTYPVQQELFVSGDMTISAGSSFCFSNAAAQIDGILFINGTATLQESCLLEAHAISLAGTMNVDDGDVIVTGNFTQLSFGFLNLNAGSFILDREYTGNYYNFGGVTYLNGGSFQVTYDGIQFGSGTQFYHNGGTLRVGWSFKATDPGAFQPSQGAVEFIGSRSAAIECSNGNYFHDLVFSKASQGNHVTFSTDVTVNHNLEVNNGTPLLFGHTLNVTNNVVISGGLLSAGDQDDVINVGGSWISSVGPNGFAEGNGTVNFISDQMSFIYTDTFNDVNITKNSSAPFDVVISAGEDVAVSGSLTIDDCCLKLQAGSTLDVDGTLTLEIGGGLNLNTGDTPSAFRLAGDLYDYNEGIETSTGFNALDCCHVILDGNTDQVLSCDYNEMCFDELTVNKAGGRVLPSRDTYFWGNFRLQRGQWHYDSPGRTKTFYGDLIIDEEGFFSDSTGTAICQGNFDSNLKVLGNARFGVLAIDKIPGFSVNLSGNAILSGTTAISLTSGDLNLNGHTCKFNGYMSIWTGGRLLLSEGSLLDLGDGASLTIGGGGEFRSLASGFMLAHVTSSTGYYSFTAYAGAVIAAEYTVFEKMDASGITLWQGALVDTAHAFTGCYFQNGAAGGTLLRIEIQQDLTVWFATFPTNVWGSAYNVSREEMTGTVTFRNYGGGFAGEDYDYDPCNNIVWGALEPPATPQNLQIFIVGNEAVLTWDPVPSATGYRIYRALSYDAIGSAEEVGTTDSTIWGDESILVYPTAFYFIKAYIE